MKEITKEKIENYFSVTSKALVMAKQSGNNTDIDRSDIIDMVERYISDAKHFFSKDDYVNAFACLNYAHGWLDCAARLGIFDVHDSKLFTVD
ncbi:DUF357 domain-containing protein [Candidatus Woesearchaeota archaeon]|nr:DUF357 domain-containing protein [Candidatus Woesearchaeota archaeon]MBW3021899.1 DUF357 domain-containing protein [Candidatus Woesearchaeota archaeon]